MLSIFNRKKSPAKEFADRKAREYTEKGVVLADEVLGRMKERFMDECFVDTSLAKFVASMGPEYILSFDLQFLYGFFHEYVQTESFPTNGYDRIKIHIIHRLVKVNEFDLDAAVREANLLEGKFNREEPLFMAISGLGRKAFHEPDDEAMLRTMKALRDHEKNRPPVA